MSLKLCFKDKIHRISQAPPDFKALTTAIITTYPNQLPPSWELYYIDSEGDKISLAHDQDYKDFLGSNPNNPSMALKIYIVPADGEPLNPPVAPLRIQKPQPQQEEQKIEEVPKKADEKQEHSEDDEDDESRESSQEELSDEVSQQSDDIRQQKDSVRGSQNKREKAARADRKDRRASREEIRQKREARPRADPQPGNEGTNNRVLNQAKELLKKITRGDMSDAEMMQALERLAKLEEAMTPEQKEELKKKKEDIERRTARRESRMAGNCEKNDEECKGEDMEESKGRRGKKEDRRGSKREDRIKDGEKPERMKNSRRRDDRERRPRGGNISKALDKILVAVEKGDAKRISKCRDQALERLSEEEKKALEPVFEMLAKGANADSLRKAIEEVEEKLLNGSDGDEKMQIEMAGSEDKGKDRRGPKRSLRKEKVGEESDEKRGEQLKNYSKEVREKALRMKEILPSENIDKLWEYVAESPEEMSVEELVAAYKP